MKDNQDEQAEPGHSSLIGRIWLGKLPLSVAFWNWAVLGGLIVNLITSATFLFLLASDQIIAGIVGGYLFSLPYNFIVTVGVWRSADNYEGDRRWAELAKLVTIVGMLLLSFT